GEPDVARLLEEVDLIRYSTTQGTNAICERKGPRLGLILLGGNQSIFKALSDKDPELYSALIGDRTFILDEKVLSGDSSEVDIVKAINGLTA
ncbi:hydantoinase/oxoprolinase N-terminal domain-containing protein, partial [Acinetobacter baumannii]